MSIKRLSTVTPDLYALTSIIPAHLQSNENFIEFIETYFEWMQEEANSPGSVINQLVETRDIDLVDDVFIPYLQKEFAVNFPDIRLSDKRKLYKQVNDIYRSKGSIPSFQSLFSILFADKIELYYPRVDVLRLSDGAWDDAEGRYTDNNGFASDRKYIHDNYYYQDFSYVIKSGQTVESWLSIVKKLLHPSGFNVFGEIQIVSMASFNIPTVQIGTGYIPDQNTAGVRMVAPTVSFGGNRLVQTVFTIEDPYNSVQLNSYPQLSKLVASFRVDSFGSTMNSLENIKFGMKQSISEYLDYTLQDTVDDIKLKRLPNSEIYVEFDNGGTITANGVNIVGTGTNFQQQFKVGDYIRISGTIEMRRIESITSNQAMTIDSPFGIAVTNQQFMKLIGS